eukprot:2790622-Pyramimonas_sp.AAC.1
MLVAVAPPIPLCPGRPSRVVAAVRDHPLRTPLWCRESAMPAVPWTSVMDSGRSERPPPAHTLMLSRICHACCA